MSEDSGVVIPLPLPGDRVGAYRIVERIGQGGAGFVYKAERGGRFYAIKVLNTLELSRWPRRELHTLLRLQLDHVVRFHAFDTWPEPDRGYPCIITDFVDGWPLDQWARRFNPGCREALGVYGKLVRALWDIFRQGVLHRDVKESNVLIRRDDGEPVVIDFGFSALLGTPTETMLGCLPPGTPEYRSPEALGFLYEKTDALSYTYALSDELWALGVLLYWLLTDRLPFGERRTPGLNARIRQDTPEAPHVVNPRVPEAVSRLCLRMLDKQRAERFQDYEALGTALESLLDAAREDAAWDVPLIDPEAPGESSEWTPQPRRGGLPPEPVVPAVETPLPMPPPDPSRSHPRRATRWGSLLLLGLLSFLPWTALKQADLPEVSAQMGATQHTILFPEMAKAASPAELDADAEPIRALPPAPDANAMSNPSPAKKKTPVQRQDSTCAPMIKRVCVAGVCSFVLTACSGAPVRPETSAEPPPEECPPGAVKTMRERFGITVGDQGYGMVEDVTGLTHVREGRTEAIVTERFGRIPEGSVLYGRFLFSKKYVDGRYTQVRLPDGTIMPVCVHVDVWHGHLERLDTGGGDTARVASAFTIRAVDLFE